MIKNSRTTFVIFVFIFCLISLLCNDFYLKASFHNTLTGKLSDFAGLMIFPWFWSLVFKRKAQIVYLFTALGFIFWKLKISQPFLEGFKNTFGISLARVVDPSDLMALAVLPISYFFFCQSEQLLFNIKKAFKYPVAALSIFAFLATSDPMEYVVPDWELNYGFVLPFSKVELLTQKMDNASPMIDSDSILLGYSYYGVSYSNDNYNLNFLVEIKEKGPDSSLFTITKLQNYSYLRYGRNKQEALNKRRFFEICRDEIIPYIKKSPSNSPLLQYWVHEGR